MYKQEVINALAKVTGTYLPAATEVVTRAEEAGFDFSVPESLNADPLAVAKAVKRFYDERDDVQFKDAIDSLSTPWHLPISLSKVTGQDIDAARGMMETAYAFGYDHKKVQSVESYAHVIRSIIRLNNYALDRP